VVDVKVLKLLQSIHHEGHESSKRLFLLHVIACPYFLVHDFALIVTVSIPEKILQPHLIKERISFNVEIDISGGRIGQQTESTVLFERQKFVKKSVLRPTLQLNL